MASTLEPRSTDKVDNGDVPADQEHRRRPPDQQNQSLFFSRLPQEVKDIILRDLFSMTRLSLGARDLPDQEDRVRTKPDPNALALPRTCRRARNDVGQTWVRHVLINFEDIETLLNRLTFVPDVILGQTCHMRVPVRPARKFWRRYTAQGASPHGMPEGLLIENLHVQEALGLLPGLRLDTLTVVGPRLCHWHEIGEMMCRGDG